jgi:DNA-binding NarL/FixJ family response regulator
MPRLQPTGPLWLALGDRALYRALRAQLARLADWDFRPVDEPLDGAPPGAIVVSTPSVLGIQECRELANRGIHVVILCPVLRNSEREAYLAAGAAAYVPMSVEGRELYEALRAICGTAQAPAGGEDTEGKASRSAK